MSPLKAIVVPKRPACQTRAIIGGPSDEPGIGCQPPGTSHGRRGRCTIVAVAETNGFSLRRMVPATQGLWPCQGLRTGGVLALRDWSWKKVRGQ